MFRRNIMENHMGSKPRNLAMGIKMGAQIVTTAQSSINIPKIMRITCIPVNTSHRLMGNFWTISITRD
jgi:hypothetical protein